MSQENVEVVKRAWGELGLRGEFPLEFWDEDLRIDNMPEFPIQGPYHGHQGLARWWDDIAEVIDDLRFELDEVIGLDAERVLSIQRTSGRASHTRIELEVLWASVFTLRDGKIVHAQGYWTPEQARQAAGLSE